MDGMVIVHSVMHGHDTELACYIKGRGTTVMLFSARWALSAGWSVSAAWAIAVLGHLFLGVSSARIGPVSGLLG